VGRGSKSEDYLRRARIEGGSPKTTNEGGLGKKGEPARGRREGKRIMLKKKERCPEVSLGAGP